MYQGVESGGHIVTNILPLHQNFLKTLYSKKKSLHEILLFKKEQEQI